LSDKWSTGQGIAGRLFEGLRTNKVFLDSEAKFKIYNLRKIVERCVHLDSWNSIEYMVL